MIEDEIARGCALLDAGQAKDAGCAAASTSPEAAAAVIARYYAALDSRDFATAWRQWGNDGPAGQTRAQFEAGFEHTRSTGVTIGTPKDPEGAAGSIYVTVPVKVDAVLDTGKAQHFEGQYVLRRVNGVDGATPDQLRWHIASAKLEAAPSS